MADVQIAVDGQQNVQVALSTISETQIVASLPTFQGAVVENIDDLSDVDTITIPKQAGGALVWNGAEWVASPTKLAYTNTEGGIDTDYNSTVLQLNFDHPLNTPASGIVDDSPLNNTFSGTGLVTSTNPRSGTGALAGTINVVSPSSAIDRATNDAYTIECWVRDWSTSTNNNFLINFNSGTFGGGFRVRVTVAGQVGFTSGTSSYVTHPTLITRGTWSHVAVTRQAGVSDQWRVHVNGVASSVNTTGWSISRAAGLTIGSTLTVIDMLRVTNGVARYGAATFTPPSLPYVKGNGYFPSSIDTFDDVDTSSTAPASGQTLLWDSASSTWKPGTVATAAQGALADTALQPASSVNALSDVDTSGVVAGQILQWNGSKWVGVDFDAARYIAAVQGADGQSLEPEVQDAINQFIMGCKSDGIWEAIKVCCILAGARTLSGALVPLKGAAPTNFNFVAGDYDRKTGLVGNASSKYLDTNRLRTAEPQNSYHISTYVSTMQTLGTVGLYAGNGVEVDTSPTGFSLLGRVAAGSHYTRNTCSTLTELGSAAPGFFGTSRSSPSAYIARQNGVNTSISQPSEVLPATTNKVFTARLASGSPNAPTDARLAFYSIGESLDLALLDSRVTQLMTGIASALPLDVDAAAYISAVEAADGQSLEPGVKLAIDRFVVGCKDDGIWSAIKAACILAGARTLAGALVPLVGAAPTNFNLVAGDYDRKTGLVGDGSSKYLNSNRNSNSDPNSSIHQSIYVSTAHLSGVGAYIGVGAGNTGATHIISNRTANELAARNRNSTANTIGGSSAAVGFIGSSRASSSSYSLRANGSSTAFTVTAQASVNADHFVFARNEAGFEAYTTARLAFYSIGESLDLALLDARVTQLMTDLAAAIP